MDNKDLDWMVERRNQIQTLMVRVLRARGKLQSSDWQLLVGAVFSLWRAVFICDPDDMTEKIDIETIAGRYLTKVIETNAISFADDKQMRGWAGGYYVNNALFRLDLRSAKSKGTRGHDESLQDLWQEAFEKLTHVVDDIA